jgi:hypothetical protein
MYIKLGVIFIQYKWLTLLHKMYTTGATCDAGTTYPSAEPEFIPSF